MPRVFVRGRAAEGGGFGRFSQRVPLDKQGRVRGVWIPADRPQPSGAWFKSGGWAVYRSAAHYRAAMGQRSRRFVLTGRSARGYVLKPMGPTRVRLLPTGKRGRGQPSNKKVMAFQARSTGKSPIKPSRAEVRALGALAQTLLTPQLIEAAHWSALGVKARKVLASRQKALATLNKKERTARAEVRNQGRKR
jgi:hypothetical protein